MRILTKTAWAMLIAGIAGCDIVNEDVTPRELGTTVYAQAKKPALLNVAAIANGKELIFSGNAAPALGTFKTILDGQYVVYTPNAAFDGQRETLRLQLSEKNSKETFSNLNLTFASLGDDTPCDGLTGVYDFAQVKQGESLVLDLLDNDIFCGIGYNGGFIGEVALDGAGTEDFLLELGPGRSAKFRYTPKPGYKGKFSVIYNLGINWLSPGNSHHVSHEEILANPKKYLEAFTTAMVEIEVVE